MLDAGKLSLDQLFDEDMMGDDLDAWLAGSALMKRTFRNVAIVAGLIERSHQGRRKSGRQATFSSDILYDTLARHDPDHLLLQLTREEAMRGLVDFGRLEDMLARIDGRIDHVTLPRVSPLAAPLFLEPGKIPVHGKGRERLAEDAARALLRAAGLD
jgi:ATP-dependent Lhr-like helicase